MTRDWQWGRPSAIAAAMHPVVRPFYWGFLLGWLALLPLVMMWPEFWNPVGSWAWPMIVGALVIATVVGTATWLLRKLF